MVVNESLREFDGWGSGAGTQDFYRSTDWIRKAIENLTRYAHPLIPYGVTVQPLERSLWEFYCAGSTIALAIHSFDPNSVA